jgi:hypothetical protein
LYLQNHCAKNSLVFSLFPKTTSMTPCFHKDFWKIKVYYKNRNHFDVCPKQTSSENSGDSLER